MVKVASVLKCRYFHEETVGTAIVKTKSTLRPTAHLIVVDSRTAERARLPGLDTGGPFEPHSEPGGGCAIKRLVR